MKNLVLVILFGVSVSLATAHHSDTTKVKNDKELHPGHGLPIYTPFLTMFEEPRDNWKVAFAIIVTSDDRIHLKDTIKDCRGELCEEAIEVNVYHKDSTIDRKGDPIEEWIGNNNRIIVTDLDGSYELRTFIMKLNPNTLPKKAPFRILIGEQIDEDNKIVDKTHQGGAIHWPD